MSKKQRIIELYFRNNYEEKIRGDVAKWITDPEGREEKYIALEKMWAESPADCDKELLEKSFRRTERKIQRLHGKERRRASLPVRIARIAAVLILPVLGAGITYLNMDNRRGSLELAEYYVPKGHTDTLTLPDNTSVILNAGSTLIYPVSFKGPRREVYINGEAVFEVEKNAMRPFVVKTADMDIRVVGTRFNISSYSDDDATVLTLSEGKVIASLNHGGNESYNLLPNQEITYDRHTGQANLRNTNVEKSMAWLRGHMLIEDMPMGQLARIIERKYGIAVHYNSARYGDEKITAKFRNNEDLAELLSVLEEIIPSFRYKLEGNDLFIF